MVKSVELVLWHRCIKKGLLMFNLYGAKLSVSIPHAHYDTPVMYDTSSSENHYKKVIQGTVPICSAVLYRDD